MTNDTGDKDSGGRYIGSFVIEADSISRGWWYWSCILCWLLLFLNEVYVSVQQKKVTRLLFFFQNTWLINREDSKDDVLLHGTMSLWRSGRWRITGWLKSSCLIKFPEQNHIEKHQKGCDGVSLVSRLSPLLVCLSGSVDEDEVSRRRDTRRDARPQNFSRSCSFLRSWMREGIEEKTAVAVRGGGGEND